MADTSEMLEVMSRPVVIEFLARVGQSGLAANVAEVAALPRYSEAMSNPLVRGLFTTSFEKIMNDACKDRNGVPWFPHPLLMQLFHVGEDVATKGCTVLHQCSYAVQAHMPGEVPAHPSVVCETNSAGWVCSSTVRYAAQAQAWFLNLDHEAILRMTVLTDAFAGVVSYAKSAGDFNDGKFRKTDAAKPGGTSFGYFVTPDMLLSKLSKYLGLDFYEVVRCFNQILLLCYRPKV